MSGGDGNIVVQSLEYHLLHLEDLISRIGTIADVDQIAQFRRIDLLILGGNEKASDTDKLQLGTLDLLDRQVPVDQIDTEVECLRHQLELEVNLNQPVHEDGTHPFVDVGLVFHINGPGRGDLLLATKVIVLQRGGARLVRMEKENDCMYGSTWATLPLVLTISWT